jgi:hypothetical protein
MKKEMILRNNNDRKSNGGHATWKPWLTQHVTPIQDLKKK